MKIFLALLSITWFSICACSIGSSEQSVPDSQGRNSSAPSRASAAKPHQIGEYVRVIFQDRAGNFLFSTSKGIRRYDGESLTYIREQKDYRVVEEILQDASGATWFAMSTGVSRYKDGKFTDFTTADGLSNKWVMSMMLDSAGTVWVGTRGGVCRFDGESFLPFSIPRAKVDSVEVGNVAGVRAPLLARGMAEDQEGNLWFAMNGGGVQKFDGESFTAFTRKDGLPSNDVRTVYVDRKGRVWFGTLQEWRELL